MNRQMAAAELNSFKNEYPNLNHWLASLNEQEQIMVLKGLATTDLMRRTFPNFAEFINGMTKISSPIFDPIEDPVSGVERELRVFFGDHVPQDLAELLNEFRDDDLGDLAPAEEQTDDLGALAATTEPETETTVVFTFIAGNHSFQVRGNDRQSFADRLVAKIQELRNSGLPVDQIPPVFRNLSERFWPSIAENVYEDQLAQRQGTAEAQREVRSFAAKNSTKG